MKEREALKRKTVAVESGLQESQEALVISAFEYGYRCAEKNMNLQAALIELRAMLRKG